MKRPTICLISQFPPPIHGLSKAADTLLHSALRDEFAFETVDLKRKSAFPLCMLSIGRSDADLFYFAISQSCGGNLRDLAILKLLALRRKRCLIHLHGGHYRAMVDALPRWQRYANFRAMRYVTGAIVLTESFRSIFAGMLDDDRIRILSNGADDDFIMPDGAWEANRAALARKDVLDVLYLSNLIPSKGYMHVLDMARQEAERVRSGEGRRFHFHFAGAFDNARTRQAFCAYLSKHELSSFVTFHGVVEGEAKRKLLQTSDIFALLTRYPREGQPISLLEAMGNGLTIVASDHAGIPDVVQEGVHGMLFASGRESDAYAWMRSLSNADIAAMGAVNRAAYRERYTQEIHIDAMRRLFREAIEEAVPERRLIEAPWPFAVDALPQNELPTLDKRVHHER